MALSDAEIVELIRATEASLRDYRSQIADDGVRRLWAKVSSSEDSIRVVHWPKVHTIAPSPNYL